MNKVCEWLSSRTGEACVYSISIAEGVVSMSAMTAGCVLDFKHFSWGLLPFCVTTIRVFLLLLQSSRSPLLTEEFCIIMMGASSVWLAIVYMYIMAQNPAKGAMVDYVYIVSGVLVAANLGILFLSTSVMVAVTKSRQREEEHSTGRTMAMPPSQQDKPAFSEEDLQNVTLRTFEYGDPAIEESSHDIVCIICLLGYQEGEAVRQLRCGHMYHERCIDAWLFRSTAGRALCPMRCSLPVSLAQRAGLHTPMPLAAPSANGASATQGDEVAMVSRGPVPESIGHSVDVEDGDAEEWVIDVDEGHEAYTVPSQGEEGQQVDLDSTSAYWDI